MNKIIIFIFVFFVFGCNDNHECCSHTQHEKERYEYINNLNNEELQEYEECRKQYRPHCYGHCYDPVMNSVIIDRCIERCIHNACN